MSKQSEAKEAQGYNPKPIPRICANCAHYRSESAKKYVGTAWESEFESNKRCGTGGFAVKKTATCNIFQPK